MAELRVIELGGQIAAGYSAKLLADAGAMVIKLELPTGDPLRQQAGLFAALNINKQSAVVDYVTDPAQLDGWLTWADVLIHDFDAERAAELRVSQARLLEDHPTLVTCALTPFGHTGPYAQYTATELTLSNAGGWANLCPATHPDPNLPPLKVAGHQCQMMAAISATTTTLACVRQRDASGIGEYIDFSVQAYVASVLEAAIPAYGYREEVINRTHPRSLIPWRIFQAKDAPIFIVCIEQDQWERLVKLMGDPDWASLPAFVDQPARAENQDLVHTLVQEFVSEWNAQDLYHAAQRERICVAPVLGLDELAENEHLLAREFFRAEERFTVMAPAVLTSTGRATQTLPAPALGEAHTTPDGKPASVDATAEIAAPLCGIRVLDLTWAWAGPFCSLNLAHLGAEVTRIESASRADLYRRLPIYPVGIEEGLNCSGMFNQWNQGKASVTVNLGSAEGIELIKRLVAKTDVVVQNFATGVLARLGLAYETLRDINPAIILASISGYGQSGPYRDYMGYGPAIPPLTGLSAATGFVDGEAEEIGLSMPDPTAGITAAYGILAALRKRDETGLGDHLDISLWEATAVLNVAAWMEYQRDGRQPERQGNRDRFMAPHGVFPTRGDDQWISIACQNEQAWRQLATLAQAERREWNTLPGRLAHVDELEAHLSRWTAQHDRWVLTEELQSHGIAAFPTLSTQDIVNDPHLNARGFIEHLPHLEVGSRPHTGMPWLLARRTNGVRGPAPCIDADTDRYLGRELDLDADSLADLRSRGVIGC